MLSLSILRSITLIFAGASLLFGQAPGTVIAPNTNSWFMYFGDHRVKKSRFRLHLESQWRRHDVASAWQQLLVRPGVNFTWTPNVTFTAGYGFIKTHRYGEFPVAQPFPEHRFFEQASLKHSIGPVEILHRHRLEQRLLGEMLLSGGELRVDRWRHENRYRYMLRANVPLQGGTIDPGEWYVGVYNELMMNFGKNVAANVFDQNRAYGALGYRISKTERFEVGYMNQYLQQRNGRIYESNHTLQVSLWSTASFGK